MNQEHLHFFFERIRVKVLFTVIFLLPITLFSVYGQVTIQTESGNQSYNVSSLGFSNADILNLKSDSDSTAAVVVDGSIDFYVPTAGTYTITKGSTVTESTKTYLQAVTYTAEGSEGSAGGVMPFGQYKGAMESAAVGTGTAERPLTGLTHFIGINTAGTGDVCSSWKQANTYAGYDWWGTIASDRGVCYLLMEDRNETTGKLLASIYFDPTISEVGHESLRGPHVYDFIFNPSDEIITTALAAHSTYKRSTERQAEALDSVQAVRDAENSMLLANVSFMRAYITKAKTYTFDMVTISNGKFQPGDVLTFAYILGSADKTVYHGTGIDPTSANYSRFLALEANAQSQVSIDTVDDEGYVKFNICGGGFFSITKSTQTVVVGLDTESINFTSSGGTSKIVLPGDNTNWSAISNSGADWYNVSINTGTNNDTLIITADANTGAERIDTLIVTGDAVTDTIIITQNEQIYGLISTGVPYNNWVFSKNKILYVHTAESAKISVYNISGRQVDIKQATQGTTEIPVLENGLYILGVTSTKGETSILKCVVQ